MDAGQTKVQHHDNSFFGDPILFQIAAGFHAALLPEFADLGAYAAGEEAQNRARLITRLRPKLRLYDDWGQRLENVDIHPAYHSLLTRARHAGIAGSLYEKEGEEAHVRHRARTMRLFILAGLDTAHLQELCLTSAGLGCLKDNSGLFGQWETLLSSRMHDPSEKPFPQKEGAALSFAILEDGEHPHELFSGARAEKIFVGEETAGSVCGVNGEKAAVINPLADGFLVSATFEKEPCVFLVPRILATGEKNGISLAPAVVGAVANVKPEANLHFVDSAGWMIGEKGVGAQILDAMRERLTFDATVMTAGVMRAAMRASVDLMRHISGVAAGKNSTKAMAPGARALADAALDCAAASVLIMRLARAIDLAAEKPLEKAFAAIIAPALGLWLPRVAWQVVDCAVAVNDNYVVMEGSNIDRIYRFLQRNRSMEVTTTHMVKKFITALETNQDAFETIVSSLGSEIGTIGVRTAEVLRVAARMALDDASCAFVLLEQLLYTVASAALRQLEVDVVATAFVESRLGGQWRSTYGTLSPRFNAGFILESLYPTA